MAKPAPTIEQQLDQVERHQQQLAARLSAIAAQVHALEQQLGTLAYRAETGDDTDTAALSQLEQQLADQLHQLERAELATRHAEHTRQQLLAQQREHQRRAAHEQLRSLAQQRRHACSLIERLLQQLATAARDAIDADTAHRTISAQWVGEPGTDPIAHHITQRIHSVLWRAGLPNMHSFGGNDIPPLTEASATHHDGAIVGAEA